MLKSKQVYRYGRIVLSGEESHCLLRRQLAYVMRTKIHTMRHFGMFGQIVGVDPDGKGMDLSIQRIINSSESNWVYMTIGWWT